MSDIQRQMNRALAKIEARMGELQDSLDGELQDAGKRVLRDAQNRAPVASGELVRSGYVKHEDSTTFVGFDAPHASIVHEYHPDEGEREYLADAVQDEVQNWPEGLARDVRRRSGPAPRR